MKLLKDGLKTGRIRFRTNKEHQLILQIERKDIATGICTTWNDAKIEDIDISDTIIFDGEVL